MSGSTHNVTVILQAISDGDRLAAESLLPLVYDELRRLAHSRMRGEPSDHTLQATALVHEAYLRLVGNDDVKWANRAHFFGAAAEAMRRVLIERARRTGRVKHGGGRQRVGLDGLALGGDESSVDLLSLDEALTKLESLDGRMSDIVKLRFFAGLSVEDTASALGVSDRTVNRAWIGAKAWLRHELDQMERSA